MLVYRGAVMNAKRAFWKSRSSIIELTSSGSGPRGLVMSIRGVTSRERILRGLEARRDGLVLGCNPLDTRVELVLIKIEIEDVTRRLEWSRLY